jgi:hypothetical protein
MNDTTRKTNATTNGGAAAIRTALVHGIEADDAIIADFAAAFARDPSYALARSDRTMLASARRDVAQEMLDMIDMEGASADMLAAMAAAKQDEAAEAIESNSPSATENLSRLARLRAARWACSLPGDVS